jgi:parallel beta-helix repeat protein
MKSKLEDKCENEIVVKGMKSMISSLVMFLCLIGIANASLVFYDSLNGSSYNEDSHNVSFVNGYIGLCAKLDEDDSYIRYPGNILPADQGTIDFYWKPPKNIYKLYSYRHEGWTDFGSYKPPSGGYLLDNIGWRAAPKGSFSLSLMPIDWKNPDSPISWIGWSMWSGSKWYCARNNHCSRPTLYADVVGSKVILSWNSTYPIWLWDPNVWYRITVTWGPKGMHLYVNGKEWANNSYTGSICTSKSFALGQDPGYWPYGPHSMHGCYDEFKIYDEQITPSNSDVSRPSGYVIYYGTESGNYTHSIEVGNVSSYELMLPPGKYYFAIAAKTDTGFIGPFSSEVEVDIKDDISSIIYVPDDYEKIKWAVENATDGSTIYVRSGTYSEYNINVNKSLRIIGLGKPLLAPSVGEGIIYGFNVTADDVYISGFKFGSFESRTFERWGTGYGIIVRSRNVTVEDCEFIIYNGKGVDHSVRIEGFNVTVRNCTFNSGTWNAGYYTSIEIVNAANVRIENNTFIEEGNAISIQNSSDVALINNYFEDDRSLSYSAIVTDPSLLSKKSEKISIINNKIVGKAWVAPIEIRSPNSVIAGNIIKDVSYGIHLLGSAKNSVVRDNVIDGIIAGFGGGFIAGGGYGIRCEVSDVSLINNTVRNSNYIGIWIWGVNLTMKNNVMENNLFNFRSDECKNCLIDPSNTVNGKPIYYFYNRSGVVVPSNAGLVILEKCMNSTVKNVTISNNFRGIHLRDCTNITIENVTVTESFRGIEVAGGEDIAIHNSTIVRNYEWGIRASKGGWMNLTIANNEIHDNGNGMLVCGSYGYSHIPIRGVEIYNNRIYNNTFKELANWKNYGIRAALTDENFTIRDNVIFNNSEGIYITDAGYFSVPALITNNTIYNNTDCGVWAVGKVDITQNVFFKNKYGIYTDRSTINLERNILEKNDYGLYIYYSTLKGEFNEIRNNTIGVTTKLSTTNLTFNNITQNQKGVVVEEHYWHGGSVNLTFNNIVNYEYNVINNEKYNISAIYNWWGTTNESVIEAKNLDYNDDNTTGYVFYKPYLTKPFSVGMKFPIAEFKVFPKSPLVNQTVIFNASLSYDSDGYIVNYTWDFGDGNVTTTNQPVITHIYSSAGNYTVTLMVTDDSGLTNSTSQLLIVTVKGDFNGNGIVDIGDVAYVAYMVVGRIPQDLRADFNGNGRVDIGDLAKVAYYLIGKINEL